MNKTTFMELWNDMSAALPNKSYDNPRLFFLYFDEAKQVSDEDSAKLLKAVLKECDFFPKLHLFAEICSKYKPVNAQNVTVKNKVPCDYCNNVGFMYDDMHDNRTLMLICPMCEKGRWMKKPIFKFYTEKYDASELERLKQENLRFRNSIGDPKEYFFKVIQNFGRGFTC